MTIQNLMPATVYIFRVMAQNKHGSGESSAPLRVETQPEGESSTCLLAIPVGRLIARSVFCVALHTIASAESTGSLPSRTCELGQVKLIPIKQ